VKLISYITVVMDASSVHGESVTMFLNYEVTFFVPLPFEGVSQSCFDFVAAIFRLRKLLEFNKRFSQTKVCGYKKPNYDTVSLGRG